MRTKELFSIDYLLLLASLLLVVLGILFIYSSGLNAEGEHISREYSRQIIWASSGFILILILSALDYRIFFNLSPYIYGGILLMLIYTIFFGRIVHGARRGIGIGFFSFQPAEFAKVSTILFLARYLDSSKRVRNNISRFIISCLIVFVPMGMVLLQPDLGTSLVFIPILVTMVFIAGFPLRFVIFLAFYFIATALLIMLPYWEQHILRSPNLLFSLFFNPRFTGLCALVFIVIIGIAFLGYKLYKKRYFYWICYFFLILLLSLSSSFAAHRVLREYQVMRLIVFLDPSVDPRGAGWNIIQSMTAIGSGHLWGKGFLQGTHSNYRFLPEQSTDFIFSIYGEEFGFLGGLLIFSLFLLIAIRLTSIMKTTTDSFGANVVAGLLAMYIFHFFINIGMTMGVMPITGIPLYFMSYGGSALITAMAGVGLSMSIFLRRYRR